MDRRTFALALAAAPLGALAGAPKSLSTITWELLHRLVRESGLDQQRPGQLFTVWVPWHMRDSVKQLSGFTAVSGIIGTAGDFKFITGYQEHIQILGVLADGSRVMLECNATATAWNIRTL